MFMFLAEIYVSRASAFTQNPEFSLPKGFCCGEFYSNVHKYMHTHVHVHKKKKIPKKTSNPITQTKPVPNLTALFYFQGSNFTTRTRIMFSLV